MCVIDRCQVMCILNLGSCCHIAFQEKHINMYLETMASAAAAAKLLQSCLTLCNSIDGSPPGSPVPGILQESGQWGVIV